MRSRVVATFALIVLAAGTSCGATNATSNDAGTEAAALQPSAFCDGLPGLPDKGVALDPPFVTFQDDAGQGCVLRLGEHWADPRVCGDAGPSALIEPNCSSTSLVFALWGSAFSFAPELYVQGGYAFTRTAGQSMRNGRVLEVAIDSTAGDLVTGHFQIELQSSNPGPPTRANGTFGLCATIGASIEPCPQPVAPPPTAAHLPGCCSRARHWIPPGLESGEGLGQRHASPRI